MASSLITPATAIRLNYSSGMRTARPPRTATASGPHRRPTQPKGTRTHLSPRRQTRPPQPIPGQETRRGRQHPPRRPTHHPYLQTSTPPSLINLGYAALDTGPSCNCGADSTREHPPAYHRPGVWRNQRSPLTPRVPRRRRFPWLAPGPRESPFLAERIDEPRSCPSFRTRCDVAVRGSINRSRQLAVPVCPRAVAFPWHSCGARSMPCTYARRACARMPP